ncbi:MAG TPA: peptidoglycan-binding protein [Solirubrobacteraceae bacterium]|nr:peptidoglycan-binding protein [Solirubrobacteraceae bacterium]
MLWSPATSFARDTTRAGGKQTEQGGSLKTALVSAGLLVRGAGYGTENGSAAVRGLQLRLRGLGFGPGPIDGLFGPLTQGAVERFQLARGLPADGVVGPDTRTPLLTRPVGRDSRPAGSSRPDRPGRHRAAPEQRTPDRPPAGDAPPPRDGAPDTGGAPRVPAAEPQPSDGLAPEAAAGLGALAMAVLLGGAWLLGRRRRGGTAAGHRAERHRSPATGLRLGIVCAALLAVFAIGAATGALFATQASPGERQTEAARSTAVIPDVTGAGGAGVAVQRRPHRSPSSP